MALLRRAILGTLGCASLVLAIPKTAALDLYDEPQTIIQSVLERYAGKDAPDLMTLPFVHRIRVALARTDIAVDPVINAAEIRLSDVRVGPTRMIDATRGKVEARFRNTGKEQTAIFELDRTSGDWLITEIRHANGITLRTLLQIPSAR